MAARQFALTTACDDNANKRLLTNNHSGSLPDLLQPPKCSRREFATESFIYFAFTLEWASKEG